MPDGPDRRREPRREANGPVILRVQGEGPDEERARLLDIARSGFRARHTLPGLRPGQIVDFQIAGYPGRARVVWTRIVGKRVESGFLILTGNGE